ncbi:pilus assembly protein [Siccirubricoccus sp. G192]|nr:pilus assembly protein [Siccirubricoccus sp. G192]
MALEVALSIGCLITMIFVSIDLGRYFFSAQSLSYLVGEVARTATLNATAGCSNPVSTYAPPRPDPGSGAADAAALHLPAEFHREHHQPHPRGCHGELCLQLHGAPPAGAAGPDRRKRLDAVRRVLTARPGAASGT